MSDEAAREVYEKARLGQAVTLGDRPAVLVVDFSCGFTEPESTLGSDLTPQVEATRRLLDVAREGGLPVVFTTIAFEPSLKDGGLWLRKVPALGELQLGGHWVEIDPRLGAREDETVIVKKGASAFFGTNLASVLVTQGVDSIVLCGATTSGCVRATAIDLMQLGWPTIVPRECVGDRAQAPHEANLFDIQAKYADVVSLEDALSYLESVPGKVGTLA
ncbi:MAG TPA: isochorismatase family protein [Gaiellaceae bacterium]|nr:isochorismatase family protein [Gaiellaceae bacterium]